MRTITPPPNYIERFHMYTSYGFSVLHYDNVLINPNSRYPNIEVDFSGITDNEIVLHAINKAYESGLEEGKRVQQKLFREVIGLQEKTELY
jgi:hypothetical protein